MATAMTMVVTTMTTLNDGKVQWWHDDVLAAALFKYLLYFTWLLTTFYIYSHSTQFIFVFFHPSIQRIVYLSQCDKFLL